MKRFLALILAAFLLLVFTAACSNGKDGGDSPEPTSGSVNVDGGVYTGTLSGGVPNGEGEIAFTNGNRYVGIVKDGKANGQGSMIDVVSEGKYIGAFVNGAYEGEGVFEFDNGGYYEGSFKGGKLKGEGRFVWPSGPIFEGTFDGTGSNIGDLTGTGHLVYDTVVTYDGPIALGYPTSPNGDGKFTWNGTFPQYTGYFTDFLTGTGYLDMGNGIIYEGPMGHGILNQVEGCENVVIITYPETDGYVGETFTGSYSLSESGAILLLGTIAHKDGTTADNISVILNFTFSYGPFDESGVGEAPTGVDVGGGVLYNGEMDANGIPFGKGTYAWPNDGPLFICEGEDDYRTEGVMVGYGKLDMRNGIVFEGTMNAWLLAPAFEIEDVTVWFPAGEIFNGKYVLGADGVWVMDGELTLTDGATVPGIVSTNFAFIWVPN